MFLRIHSFIFTVRYSILILYFHLFPFGVVEAASSSLVTQAKIRRNCTNFCGFFLFVLLEFDTFSVFLTV